MFFHFDIPVFKPGWKWRTFKDFPTPDLYNPEKMDTDQWMEAAKAMGGVKPLCDGSCVGHKRIQTFDPVAVKSLRLRVTVSTDKPLVTNFAAFDSRS